jgi:hypothetical protein
VLSGIIEPDSGYIRENELPNGQVDKEQGKLRGPRRCYRGASGAVGKVVKSARELPIYNLFPSVGISHVEAYLGQYSEKWI